MSDWRTATIGSLTLNFDKHRVPIKSNERVSGDTPYYGASGIIDWVAEHTHEGEYLLIAEDGENLRTRNTPIAFMARGRIWVNNHAHIVKGAPGVADTRFLHFALAMTDISGYLTGSTQPKLTRTAMDSIFLRVPCLREQRGIAEVLGALDDKITANADLADTCLSLAQARYDQALTGATTMTTVGAVMSLEYGKALAAAVRVCGDADVYGSGGVVGSHNTALVDHPGVVVGRKGTAGAVHWAERPHFPIDTTFYVKPKSSPTPLIFCYFALKGLRLNEMNSDSAVPGLNRNEAHAAIIPFPGPVELQRFDELASPLFAVRAQLRHESKRLAVTRDALLPLLMSGKIRVKDAEGVVEGVV